MSGLFYEQFEVGMRFEHALRRTVTEADNMLFSNMTLNPQPLHIDFDFAARAEFGRPIVNSLFTLGLLIGISVYETTLGTTVANLGMERVRFPAPVFHGDTIHVVSEVIAMRDSGSRPSNGIVTFRHDGFNQDNALVASCERSALMRRSAVV
jgi:acyl dehydratase